MKRILILATISLLLCSTASAFQGGGGESTKKGSNKKKEVPKKKTSGTKSATSSNPNTTRGGGTSTRSILLGQAGIEFVGIPAGEFMMGSNNAGGEERPVHHVKIGRLFLMGRYEVTHAQWQSVMGNNPSFHKNCDNCPVEQVSWDDAQRFLSKLNERNDGFHYRLPSEAEWEYACRAGTTGDLAGDVDSMAWYVNNSGNSRFDADAIWRDDKSNYLKRLTDNGNKTHPVGTKQANVWGLYDMHGNVSEWCQDEWGQDWYHGNYNGAPVDGSAWLSGAKQKYRVLRGGSWMDNANGTRSASRGRWSPGTRGPIVGFRVVAVR